MTLQTIAVEYRVPGSLDGVTPAPQFSLDPRSPDHIKPDEDNIYVVPVKNLGLIDPTFLTGSAYADRFIKWLVVYGPNPPLGPDNINVVTLDENGNVVTLRNKITINVAANGVYAKRCIFVPQGGLLQLRNLVGSAADPIVVRLGIWRPDSLKALAAMRQACCCREGGRFENTNPPPPVIDVNQFNIGIEQFCQRQIDVVTPDQLQAGTPGTINIIGSGFEATDNVVFIDPTTNVVLDPTITFVNSTQFNADFVPGQTTGQEGTYDVLVGPAQVPSCVASAFSAFEITPTT